ncbi:hypothetical protein OB905_02475 [Halobacteria archaeon AArc-dxtr1]|nr:hypothetical protein [Halobacteria archaeon AArc-dxtr1]
MGFSTSSSVALLFVAFLIVLSIALPTLFTLGSSAGDAYASQAEQIRDYKNTDIEINSTAVDSENSTTTIEVINTGSETLELSRTYLLIDGTPTDTNQTTRTVIDGDDTRNESVTNIWPPGTTLKFEAELDTAPERVAVTTEGAITDATSVDGQTEES